MVSTVVVVVTIIITESGLTSPIFVAFFFSLLYKHATSFVHQRQKCYQLAYHSLECYLLKAT